MGDWKIPDDVKYRESDEWVRIEGDTAAIGLSDYAQDQLNDMVYLELPEVGATFAKGDSFGVVESVKAASDLNMPISGEVTAVNSAAVDDPERINADPYGTWLIKIKVTNAAEADDLMDAAAYAQYCEDR
jgi:glycine cleavage system H protein